MDSAKKVDINFLRGGCGERGTGRCAAGGGKLFTRTEKDGTIAACGDSIGYRSVRTVCGSSPAGNRGTRRFQVIHLLRCFDLKGGEYPVLVF